MKNIYIKPATRVVAITNDFALLGQSTEGYQATDFSAKDNKFSSWDNDFDEEDYSEYHFSRKSLFD